MFPEVITQIERTTGTADSIASEHSMSGGCINDASVIETRAGQSFFVKSSLTLDVTVFAAEARGLQAIAKTNSLRVPDVVCSGSLESGGGFLVLEAIKQGTRRKDYFEAFGRQLAKMHRSGTSHQFGFETDNWLGSSLQPNPWTDDWATFWIQARLEHQLKMAQDNGASTANLQQLGGRLVNRIDRLFDSKEPPSLIHGDLWSGNYLSDEDGQPIIIDPACYFANREAEFGMTTLFGSFPSSFYDAYDEAWPLAEGWKSRVEIYRLYHLLNHLNLFGSGYLSGCLEILGRFA